MAVSPGWLLALTAIAVLSHGCAPKPLDARLRCEVFDAVEDVVEWKSLIYVGPDLRPGEFRRRYGDIVLGAETPAEFHRALAIALASLWDPHIQIDAAPARFGENALWYAGDFLVMARIDGEIWGVLKSGAHDSSDAPHEERWARLVSIDARPPPPPALLKWFLCGDRGAVRRLRLADPTGDEFDAEMTCSSATALGLVLLPNWLIEFQGKDRLVGYGLLPDFKSGKVFVQRLGDSEEVAFVKVWSFDADEAVERTQLLEDITAACNWCRGAKAVLLDLRGNRGGRFETAGGFFNLLPADCADIPFALVGTGGGSSSIPPLEWQDWTMMRARPIARRMAPVDAKVVVLVDGLTASAAEVVTAILRCRAGATVVGGRTMGAECGVFDAELPDGATLMYSVGGGVDPDCGSFQGRGIEPDVVVPFPHDIVAARSAILGLLAYDDAVLRAGLVEAGLDPFRWLAPVEQTTTWKIFERHDATMRSLRSHDGSGSAPVDAR